MSAGRSDTSSKRKRSTPQKFKSRKLFASSRHDILEQPEYSRTRAEGAQENQLGLSKLPVTFRNKENMPEKYPNGSVTTPRGRGRPKGSKNKTFPTTPTKVYSVREGKSAIYTSKPASDLHRVSPNRAVTPHRGRGRPKGSTKVKPVVENVPKRSRGRPKGSKNKKPPKAAQPIMLTSGQNIGRGRPRKLPHTTEALTPKRGRGRPKGSLNKVTSVKRLTHMSGTLEVKKRGRPKKMILHHPALISLTPKKPRGRPRKTGGFTTVTSRELTLMSEAFEIKKRGRPKKMILHHPALMSLTPKRPRGRPRKAERFSGVVFHHHEMKSSESNTDDDDDDDIDSEEDDEDDDEEEKDDEEEEDDDDDDDDVPDSDRELDSV